MEQKEDGALGFSEKNLDITVKMTHDGEVNRARSMPQKYNVIATFTNQGDVNIFDFTQHQKKDQTAFAKPQLRLCSHSKEGYGLSWNSINEGKLLSGSYDNTICLWDVNAAQEMNQKIQPTTTFNGHSNSVEDVAWHELSPNIFGSVGDDKNIILLSLQLDGILEIRMKSIFINQKDMLQKQIQQVFLNKLKIFF